MIVFDGKISYVVGYKNIKHYAGINFIHNHPPENPRGFAPKMCPHPGAFASKLLPGGGDLLGQFPRGGHLSINDVCHF